MPDDVLKKLALYARIKTIEDIKHSVPDWDFIDKYGDNVLTLLKLIDDA